MSAKIIALEGPDGAGKTTLAQSIAATWNAVLGGLGGAEVIHTGPPQPDEDLLKSYFFDVAARYYGAVENDWETVFIYDRLHIGELIYGPIFRGGSKLSKDDARFIDRWLDSVGATKIFVDAPNSVLAERYEQDHETKGELADDVAQVLEIAKQYRALLLPSLVPPVYRNWIVWGPKHSEVVFP